MGPLGGRGAACSEHVELGAAARRVRYGAGALELGEYFLGIARADGGLTCNRSSRSVRCARLSPHPAPRVVPQNALAYNLSCFASWVYLAFLALSSLFCFRQCDIKLSSTRCSTLASLSNSQHWVHQTPDARASNDAWTVFGMSPDYSIPSSSASHLASTPLPGPNVSACTRAWRGLRNSGMEGRWLYAGSIDWSAS